MSQIELRDYQKEAINKAKKSISSGLKRIVLVLPTGAGKTTIAAEIIKGGKAKGSSIAFLAHRKELIDQCSNRLDQMGVDHGVCKSGHRRMNPIKSVQVASVQTLINRLKVYSFDIIFIDECHRSCASTYKKILDAYPKSVVIGLTATPFRSDGMGLGQVFNELIVVRSMNQLIGDGYLIKPRYFSKHFDASHISVKMGDFDQSDVGKSISKPTLVGDMVLEWKKIASGRTTVGFCATVEHSKICAKTFSDSGIPSEHLDASLPDAEREGVLSRLASGKTMIVFNVGILSEGWDLPQTSCCIVATLTLSRMKWMQMVGRVLRPHEGKSDALIIDHYGNCFIHGPVEADVSLTLDGVDKIPRKKADKSMREGRICKECFAPNQADAVKCVICGIALIQPKKIITSDGDLVEVGSILPKSIKVETRIEDRRLKLYVANRFIRNVDPNKFCSGSWDMMSYVGGDYYHHASGVRVRWCGEISYLVSLGAKALKKEFYNSELEKQKKISASKGYKSGHAYHKMMALYGRQAYKS